VSNVRLSRIDVIDAQLSYLFSNAKELKSLLGEDSLEYINTSAYIAKRNFYNTLSPLFSKNYVQSGVEPSLVQYKFIFSSALHDLNILYSQVKLLSTDIVNNFNDIQSLVLQIEAKISKIRSLIADYRIYALYPQAGFYFLGDSFDDTGKIDKTSDSIDNACCYIDSLAGVVTLPLEESTPRVVNSVTINSESNGVSGNNNEYGTPIHSEIKELFDSNPDTWFEYERIGIFTPPLYLSITLKLQETAIVNNISVSIVNLGTKSWPIIRAIDTSTDGKKFLSIKDDLPIIDWGYENEENVFDPSSAYRQTGTTSFIFTPRKAKFVKLIFEQNSSYLIQTISGFEKERWAIGVRDIGINGLKFSAAGEIVSHDYLIKDPVKKIALSSNQTPDLNSTVGVIHHSISLDNGTSWLEISPIELVSNDIREVLNIDDIEDVSTLESKTIKYKAALSRNTEAFTSDALADAILEASEIFPFPSSAPYSMNLTEGTPIANTISIINPLGGEVGENWQLPYYVGMITTYNEDEPEFDLPFDSLAGKGIRVKVGTQEWKRTWNLDSLTSTDKKFYIDIYAKKLRFGDNTNGVTPPVGKPIFLWFDRERISFDSNILTKTVLDFSTTGIKSRVNLYREAGKLVANEVLVGSAFKIPLKHRHLYYTETTGIMNNPISAISPLPGAGDPLSTWVPFVNGYKEFTSYSGGIGAAILDGAYTVDPINGVLYFPYDETDPTNLAATPSAVTPITITYEYYNRSYIPESSWKFDRTDTSYKTILIDESVVGTEIYSVDTNNGTLDSGAKVWNLGLYATASEIVIRSMIPKTIVFEHVVNGVEDWMEVPFKNGLEEFDIFETDEAKAHCFSVDYKNGIIYSAITPLYENPLYYTITFQFTNYFAEYVVGIPLENGVHFKVDPSSINNVQLTDEYALELNSAFSALKSTNALNKVLRVTYDYKADLREDLKELEPYYSPLLKEYRIISVSEEGLKI